MIQMEYPKLPLDGLTPEEKVVALKRQVDILTDNLQIVLNSIEADVGNVDNTSDKDKPISDAVQEALDEISEALDTKVDKVTGKGLSTNDYTTSAKNKVDGIEAYVVETGTSGIWKYRKWSDGTAECWGRTSSSSFTWSSYVNGLYYNSNNWLISLPFAFADTNYVVTANTYYVGGAVGWVANANAYDSSTFKLTIVRNGNSGDVYVNIHVIGRWK